MKCKLKTMKVLLHYGSFGHHSAVQRFLVVLPFLLQHPAGSAFQYAHGHHGLATSGYFHEELSLNWDDLELQFLSKVNGPSLHSNGFHVINATFPARQTSYIMHLSKTEGLFHPEQLGMSATDASHLQCLYSGTVSEVTSGVYSQSGTVSLSTCHHEIGFEGLMILPHEQYYIRPSEAITHHHHQHISKFVKRSTNTPSVPHKAYNVNSPGGPYSKEKIDEVMKVPPAELLKATQNQSAHLHEDGDSTSSDTSNTDNEANENDILDIPMIEDNGCAGSNCKNSLPPVMVALSNKGKGKRPRAKTQKKIAQKTSTGKIVEIAVFTDEKLYRTWKGRYPKNTMAKMNQYVLAVINNMNALYKQPSMPETISFRLVHLGIETSKPRTLNDHNGHATKYLKSFCDYAKEKNIQGRLWDHALLLTGFDLQEGGSNGTAGIAWFSTMCINGLSCSLIEGYTFGSTFITTHEIGHSLGMEHDGTGPNTGCDSNSYIMSPTTGGGKTDWSKCSIKNMRDFINKGYMTNPSPRCITKPSSKPGIKFSSHKLPGQQFTASEQCTADCKACKPHITGAAPYNNICHLLYCSETKGFYSLIRSTHPALEGTTCAKGKVCRIGKCQ